MLFGVSIKRCTTGLGKRTGNLLNAGYSKNNMLQTYNKQVIVFLFFSGNFNGYIFGIALQRDRHPVFA